MVGSRTLAFPASSQKGANKAVVAAENALPGMDGYRPPEYSNQKFNVSSDVHYVGVVRSILYLLILYT